MACLPKKPNPMKFNFAFLAALLLIISLNTACNQEGTLGLNLLSNTNQSVLFTDTISMVTSTYMEDSINISPKIRGYATVQLLGSYNSSIFGTANAGFYAQVRLPRNDIDFGSGATLDSVVLVLPYQGYYGDTTTPLNVQVYELTEALNKEDSTYHTNTKLPKNSQPIATQTIFPRPKSKVWATEPGKDTLQKLPAQIRIKLSGSFAQQLFAQSGSVNLQNNENFLNYFKGIFVTVAPQSQPNAGSILYLNLLTAEVKSRLSLYYKTPNDSLQKRFDFEINSNSVRLNSFAQNYTGSTVAQNLGVRNPANGEMYLAAMAALKAKIEFSNLNGFIANRKILINKAELILKVIDQQSPYAINGAISAVGVDEFGKNTLLPLTVEQGGIYNDDPTQTRPRQGSYTINITKYFQEMIQNPASRSLYITPISSTTNANRTVLGGANNPIYAPKLQVTYTILN